MMHRISRCMCLAVCMVVILVLVCSDFVAAKEHSERDLLVLTTNCTESDASKRLLRSANIYEYEIQSLGNGKCLNAAAQATYLREALEKQSKDKPKRLILFIDGPDAILSAGPLRVVEEFDSTGAGILISSDGIFTGNQKLLDEIPRVVKGRRYPDSGAFIGEAETLNSVMQEYPDENDVKDLMTKAYSKPALKKKFSIMVDSTCRLFQNLNGATGDLELRFAGREAYLQNTFFSSVPVVIRARDAMIPVLNTFSGYLARSYNDEDGCQSCWEDMMSLDDKTDQELPFVTLAVFIEKPTPFMEEFFQNIENLNYPKEKMYLFIHNSIEHHKEITNDWVENMKSKYNEVKQIPMEEVIIKEWHAKNQALEFCLARDCSNVMFIDSDAMIDNPFTLRLLIAQNRKIVAPLLPRPGKAWSNFWGALTTEGFYARSMDYMEIVNNQRRGLWNVPYISSCFLIQRALLENPATKPSFINNLMDPDMAMCQNLRDKGVFLFLSNRVDFGHLLNTDNFNPTNIKPELWQVIENRWDWEKRYLHRNYSDSLNESIKIATPCPDVFWFPMFTERFAEEMIFMMEGYNYWSDGSHEDKRLDGGYESVPTVDTHMNQVGYHDEWMEILRAYVQPLQLRVFEGYFNDVGPPKALMAFTVRYKPDEQPSLRPHHDTSTYTINVGLNRPKIDYEGGGCRFVRYNCSVTDTKVGWMLMHPGRLTHLHEGLPTTKGTRYIIVTFVDP